MRGSGRLFDAITRVGQARGDWRLPFRRAVERRDGLQFGHDVSLAGNGTLKCAETGVPRVR
jgi:hypothetical protein